MKNLENFGVEEISSSEAQTTEGGLLFLAGLGGAFLVAGLIGAAAPFAKRIVDRM